MSLSIYGCQQNFVQRYCSMDSQKQVTKTLLWNIPVIAVLFSLSWIVGMVIFAVYADCDPYTAGYTYKYDEIVPFFVEDRFNYLPGILGLFMAALFNGALSLNVSNLNSLATVTWEDFLSQIPCLKKLNDRQQLFIIKIMATVYGFLIMAVALWVSLFSGVIESSMMVTSATSGPLLGVFLLAMLIPCANWKGAASGMIVAHSLIMWLTLGHTTVQKPVDILDQSISGCNNESFNDHIMKPGQKWPMTVPVNFQIINSTAPNQDLNFLTSIYSITYMYYAFIGCLITVIVGSTVSILWPDKNTEVYDRKLLHPITKWYQSLCWHQKYSFRPSNNLNGTVPKLANGKGPVLTPSTVQITRIDDEIKSVVSI